jgi:hypothetical protein
MAVGMDQSSLKLKVVLQNCSLIEAGPLGQKTLIVRVHCRWVGLVEKKYSLTVAVELDRCSPRKLVVLAHCSRRMLVGQVRCN